MASSSRKAARTCSCISRRFKWMASRHSPRVRPWNSKCSLGRKGCTRRTSCARNASPELLTPPRRHSGGAFVSRVIFPLMPSAAPSERLFLVDGYALIYRAFFAMIARPLTTQRGENTSAAWGIINFLLRLHQRHHPDYLGWVHDVGESFRHRQYPEYKATREKLDHELQQDFNRS